MSNRGTYEKRQRKRRQRDRATDRALVRKYGKEGFPGLGPIEWMGRRIHVLLPVPKTTGTIGGRRRDILGPVPGWDRFLGLVKISDVGEAPNPELCKRLFDGFPPCVPSPEAWERELDRQFWRDRP